MNDPIDRRLDTTFGLFEELVATLDSEQLSLTLPVPSNSIGAQLWCVIGARETMSAAMESGTWGPFRCSVLAAEIFRPETMKAKLESSAAMFHDAIANSSDDEVRTDFKLDLLEHEDQHLGQLLRYLLGLGLDVPSGWKQRFAL